MNKKGQFFLIATLIIVSVLLSFGTIYNFAMSTGDRNEVFYLAKEIKYEMVQKIDSGLSAGLDEQTIYSNILSLGDAYGISNPGYTIFLLYGKRGEGDFHKAVYNGNEEEMSFAEQGNQILLNYTIGSYTFNTTKGYNVFVVVKREENDERLIAAE